MKCYYHKDKEAVGGCVGCGHLVCADCKAMIGEKSYCKACVERLVTRMRLAERPTSIRTMWTLHGRSVRIAAKDCVRIQPPLLGLMIRIGTALP